MPVGLPAKTTYANGDVFSASDINDTNGTINLIGQTNNFYAGKNKFINGDFNVWQRGTSFSLVSNATTFTADRFIAVFNGSGTQTVSRQTNNSLIGPFTPNFFFRWNQSVAGSGGTFADLIQKVENVSTFANQTVTLSFYAKSASSVTLPSIIIYQNFGSGGSSDVTVPITTNTVIGTSWTRFNFTFTMPSIVGKTIGANNQFEIHFTMPLNQIHTTDFWGIQLEAGSAATAFQTATGTIQGELAACQRYYFRNTSLGTNNYVLPFCGNGASTTVGVFAYSPSVPMRVAPTSIDFSNLILFDGNNTSTVTAIGFAGYNTAAVNGINITVSSGLTNARSYSVATSATGGFLGLSAEL
jgi:hypothetical protein